MTDHSQRSVGHVIMVLGAVFVWGTLAKVLPVSVLNLKREREKKSESQVSPANTVLTKT